MRTYFSISELSASDTAAKKKIDNTPPPQAKAKMKALISNVLDPIRERWGAPIYVNSGFRCPILNKAIGGVSNSQHITGEAADITVGDKAKNTKLFALIHQMKAAGEITFDQLIDESDMSWIHISFSTSGKNRGQILKL